VRVHNARPVQRGVCQSILGRDCQNEGAGFLPKIEGVVFHRKYPAGGSWFEKEEFRYRCQLFPALSGGKQVFAHPVVYRVFKFRRRF
jgi:hypothetical protein